jgi:putative oxidoreductase
MEGDMLDIINAFFPYALLFLRIIVAIIFFSSGTSHLKQPGKRTDLSPGLTVLLGVVEIVAPIMIAVGIFVQIGAMMLIIVMLGAIYKKIFVWNIGF